jgi:hypothetical protein
MMIDRAMLALLNGKAIRRKSAPTGWFALDQSIKEERSLVGDVDLMRLVGQGGVEYSGMRLSTEWICATDWECGQPNRRNGWGVDWNNIVGDKGHEADPK